MPTGLFIVGSSAGSIRNLMTCNWVMQVATDPKSVATAVEVGSVTRRLIGDGGGFSVSILARRDRALVRRFVKPVDDVVLDATGAVVSMRGEPAFEVGGQLPVLASAIGWLACTVRQTVDVGSHVVFIGEVVAAGEGDGERAHGNDDPAEVLRMEDTRMSYGG